MSFPFLLLVLFFFFFFSHYVSIFCLLVLPVPSCSFLFLPVPSCSFLFLPVPSCSFLFLPVPSCSFLFLPVPSFCKDTSPEWPRGVVVSFTSASCAGLNPAGVNCHASVSLCFLCWPSEAFLHASWQACRVLSGWANKIRFTVRIG